MGFTETEATIEGPREEVHIPTMSAEMQADMTDVVVNVDDTIDEPMHNGIRTILI
jgi:hypothetical protein